MGYRLAWLREQVADMLIRRIHVESANNESDPFTKVLSKDVFIRLRSLLLNLRRSSGQG